MLNIPAGLQMLLTTATPDILEEVLIQIQPKARIYKTRVHKFSMDAAQKKSAAELVRLILQQIRTGVSRPIQTPSEPLAINDRTEVTNCIRPLTFGGSVPVGPAPRKCE